VFSNLRRNTRLNRLMRHESENVSGPWKNYCLAHNFEELAHRGHVHQDWGSE